MRKVQKKWRYKYHRVQKACECLALQVETYILYWVEENSRKVVRKGSCVERKKDVKKVCLLLLVINLPQIIRFYSVVFHLFPFDRIFCLSLFAKRTPYMQL